MLHLFHSYLRRQIQKKQSVRAFTLIETLVSVFIITVVILGPLTVATGASAYAKQTKDTMTAIYLAQEAVELLHHQQDSTYLSCVWQTGSGCPLNGRTPSEVAWRIFSDNLGYTGINGASCYSPFECSYDFIDMTNDINYPSKYISTDGSCLTLYIKDADHFYVCGGVHGGGGGYTPSSFSRSITITSMKTFMDKGDDDYNDDLRVTVTVSFRRSNGYSKQIKVVDFFHAQA